MNELYHHGIKGQKWGVRRFQNPDGSLTKVGRKHVSKEYEKYKKLADKDFTNSHTSRYVQAHNRTSDYMNNKFESEYEKKHGTSYNVDDYNKAFEKKANELIGKYYNEAADEFIRTNKNVAKTRELVEKYQMKTWYAEEDEYMNNIWRKQNG